MLRTWLQVSIVLLSVASAYFLARGGLEIRAADIAALGSTYWDHNLNVVRALAKQRADYWTGFAFVLISASLQATNLAWQLRWADFKFDRVGAALAVLTSGALFIGALFLAQGLATRDFVRAKEILEGSSQPAKE
jgi:drug/metabolite transporter (DMT)-like permease